MTATTIQDLNLNEQFQDIPAECFRIAGTVEFGDNGEGSSTIPIRLVARSPDPITHWYWGNIVHNLEGAFLRDGKPVLESSERINLDYGHRDDAVIGFANKFAITDEGLVVSGALVKMPEDFKGEDHASRIIHLARNGTPFEASINFGGTGTKLRVIDEGETHFVNGKDFEGPGIVVEEWPLRNVAVVSLGADGATKSELLSDGGDKITVELIPIERTDEMAEATETKVDLVDESQIPSSATEASQETVDVATENHSEETGTAQPVVDPQALTIDEGRKFMEAFGPDGMVMFFDGVSFEEATRKHRESQDQKIAELQNQIAALKASGSGEDDAVDFVEGDAPERQGLVPETEFTKTN